MAIQPSLVHQTRGEVPFHPPTPSMLYSNIRHRFFKLCQRVDIQMNGVYFVNVCISNHYHSLLAKMSKNYNSCLPSKLMPMDRS